MSIQTEWRPTESESTLQNERGWLAGIFLACTAYGIVFTLFVLSLIELFKTTTRVNLKYRLPLLVYVCLIFTSGTLFIGAAAKMIQLGFVDNRLFPGGPAAFEVSQFSLPINIVATATYVFTDWLMSGMVVWRCIIVYRSSRYPQWLVTVIPGLVYMGSITLGVLWLVQTCSSQSNPWSTSISINVTLPYFWLSLALNVALTVAICSRLLYYRWRARRFLGDVNAEHYTSIVAMCVESALIYSVFALCFLVSFSLGAPVQYVFLQALGEVQIIAPLLITYRVARGQAWSNRKEAQIYNSDGASVASGPIAFLRADDEEALTSNVIAV